MSKDSVAPDLPLLIALGSLIVHYEEFLSPTGYPIDKETIDSIRNQPNAQEWFNEMNNQAYLPVKRRG